MLCIACGPDNFPCKKHVIDDTHLCGDHKHVVDDICRRCDKPMYYKTKLSCDHEFCDKCTFNHLDNGGVRCFSCSKFTYLNLFTEREMMHKISTFLTEINSKPIGDIRDALTLQLFEFVTKYYKCLMIPDVKYKKLWSTIYKKNIELSEDDDRFKKFTYELYFIKKLASRIKKPKRRRTDRRRRSMRRRKPFWIRVFPYP
jgi:hypothetical protein